MFDRSLQELLGHALLVIRACVRDIPLRDHRLRRPSPRSNFDLFRNHSYHYPQVLRPPDAASPRQPQRLISNKPFPCNHLLLLRARFGVLLPIPAANPTLPSFVSHPLQTRAVWHCPRQVLVYSLKHFLGKQFAWIRSVRLIPLRA